LKPIEEHREILKKISDFAYANAITEIGFDKIYKVHPKDWDETFQNNFISKVHDGFKKAQKLVIDEILYYQNLVREKKTELKEYRRVKDTENHERVEIELQIINQRVSTFSHIMDGLAWQLLGGQIHIARRFHIGEDSSKFLDSSNIEHAIKVADNINESPLDFALISDLTNFIQIGDILVKKNNLVGTIELKEGKVNQEIKNFFRELEKDNIPITDKALDDKFDAKKAKQAKRMLRQDLRAERAVQVINSDKGIDPATEKPITVYTPTMKTVGYQQEFVKLSKALQSKSWAYVVLENCLHIGMYKEEGIAAIPAIEEILKAQKSNFIVIDWISITHNLSEPIFVKPLPPDFIIDILTGRVKVIIGLDFDNLIELFNEIGIETRWLSTKQTAKLKQKSNNTGMRIVNNRAISMKVPNLKETEIIIGDGIISKILYDNILPSNIAMTYLSVNEEE